MSTLKQMILSRDGPRPDLNYRVIVLGGNQVGKTSFISQFTRKILPEDDTHYNIDNEVLKTKDAKLHLDIVDTSGIYKCMTMLKLAIGRSQACIVIFSVNDRSSFDFAKEVREVIVKTLGSKASVVVVASKVDLPEEERVVSSAEAEALVQHEWKWGYVEAVSSNYDNVCGVFRKLINELVPIPISLSPVLERRRKSEPGTNRRRRSSVMKLFRRLTRS